MDNDKLMILATVAGIIFLCLGCFWIGFNNGYNYVKEYKDDYISKMCICQETIQNNFIKYIPEELKDYKLPK